jgi:hypothetical protein
MKIKSLLIGASALALVASAQAQTVITIVGATAFRSAAHSAIKNAYGANLTGFAYTGSDQTAAAQYLYTGTFPGISGTTIIRTCYKGSAEGIQALSGNSTYITDNLLAANRSFIPITATVSANGTASATASETLTTDFALSFSDVSKSSTNFSSKCKAVGGPIGVATFVPVISKDGNAASSNTSLLTSGNATAITNLTTQQFKRLATVGYMPAKMFTGDTTTTGSVYLVGRYDGSGTRAAMHAETGVGALTKVLQYAPSSAYSSNMTITSLSLVPAGTQTNGDLDKSFTDVAGNGGYISGGTLSKVLALALTGDLAGSNMIGWVGTGDAKNAANKGQILSYNGVKLDGIASGSGGSATLSTADKNKVRTGAYTAWSYENLFYLTSGFEQDGVTAWSTAKKAAIVTVYNKLKTDLSAGATSESLIGNSGTALDSMLVNRLTESTDGSTVKLK